MANQKKSNPPRRKRSKKRLLKKEDLTDNEIIKLVQKGEKDLFSEINERYQGKLFAYLYRLIGNREEAKDLLQDVFVKAFKNIKSYDTERNFSSWIYRIAHNESVNHIRRKGLKRFISWEDVTSTKDKMIGNKAEDGMDDVWLRKEKIKEIDDVMKKLPEKYRHILHLRYYSEKSYEEIGKVLKKPVNTVGTLISRAKKKMAEEMRKVDRKK